MNISETITYLEQLKERLGDKQLEFGNDVTENNFPLNDLIELTTEEENCIVLGVPS